ncbi:MAG: hypothetical protein EXQ70_01025 [Solirubrobacterales bacterium]|nr:hypothetical protein [Solirubrobacterales bacterium]
MTEFSTDFDFDFQVGRDQGQPTPNGGSNGGSREPEGKGNGKQRSSNGSGRQRASSGEGDGYATGSRFELAEKRARRSNRGSDARQGNGAGPQTGGEDSWFDLDSDPAAKPDPRERPDPFSDEDPFPPSGPDAASAGEVRADTPTPRSESREFARQARRRASRSSGGARGDGDVPFESLLESQPQRGRVSRGTSPLLDSMRDAGGTLRGAGGSAAGRLRELGRGGASRISALREVGARGVGAMRENGISGLKDLPKTAPSRNGGSNGGSGGPPRLPRIASRRARPPKPGRIKKLRLLIIFSGLGLLALIATFFGMMMAVSRDLPNLENAKAFQSSRNTEVFDSEGRKISDLLANNRRILVSSDEISPWMKEATVAIEDQRFYEHPGVDLMGIGRAAASDLIPGGSIQGASTITMQFVKNALEAQGSRTVLQKFREAATAYHLERQWDKDKILTEYLNTIYFGEGAYGVEAAARTYFGSAHPGCGENGEPCASELDPAEAAMLAGVITSPSSFNPRANPIDSRGRRDLVLSKMHDQGVLTDTDYEDAIQQSPPVASEIERPTEDSLAPYFTSWLRQLVVDRYGAGRAFSGGLDIHTTLDLDMQESVQQIAGDSLAGIAPTSSVVVLDNKTAEIKAMVGGSDYEEYPFNIATQGYRQPGSTWKPFTLAAALDKGISPDNVYPSQPKEFPFTTKSGVDDIFRVSNYDDSYLGSASIRTATTYSDNSVYAELGYQDVGVKNIARTARRMGIDTPISQNPSMVLGGLRQGVTPLEMAHAYQTLANNGVRVGGTLDTSPHHRNADRPTDQGTVPITKVTGPDGFEEDNKTIETPVLDSGNAETEKGILQTVITSGTGDNAATGSYAWGKTGTTENYGDAWFCGAGERYTACVWVGYRDGVTPMETEYNGEPVAGGTYPAIIWSQVMQAVESIGFSRDGGDDSSGSSSGYYAPSTATPSYSAPSGGGGGGGGSGPAAPPTPAAPPSTGGGSTGGGGVGL